MPLNGMKIESFEYKVSNGITHAEKLINRKKHSEAMKWYYMSANLGKSTRFLQMYPQMQSILMKSKIMSKKWNVTKCKQLSRMRI
jgi:hypothetical protein